MNENQRLNPNMNVAELLKEWPQVIPVFLRHRMTCVGCSMSAFETLEDAVKIHDMILEPFLEELNQAIRL